MSATTRTHRIRSTREGCGLTMGQAARLLGMPVTELSLMELNGVHADDDRLPRLGKLYHCSVAWLLGETAELSADSKALLSTIEHTGDRAVVREFMEMLSTRDPGVPDPRPKTLAEIAAAGSTSSAAIDRTVASKRRYVKRQGQTRDHHCHWPGCNTQVPPAMWGCRTHWFKLPKALRDRIWATYAPGQEVDMTPSAEYLQVADDVQRWIRENSQQRSRP
jgi:transcriptional regulator with XRE-family HTH domain